MEPNSVTIPAQLLDIFLMVDKPDQVLIQRILRNDGYHPTAEELSMVRQLLKRRVIRETPSGLKVDNGQA